MSHPDFPMPVWLTDAIVREERNTRSWWETKLPEQLKPLLVTVDQVSESLSAIVDLLAADEQLSRMNDDSFYDYSGLPPQTRRKLFQACWLLSSCMERALADISRGDFGREDA